MLLLAAACSFAPNACLSLSRTRGAVACSLSAQPPQVLGDVTTPAVVVDADAIITHGASVEELDALIQLAQNGEAPAGLSALLDGNVYLHSRVVRRAARTTRYHRDATYELCVLDLPFADHFDDGAYLCCGLNNHYDACYYWARSAGGGARLSAPGIGLQRSGDGLVEVVRMAEKDIPSGEQTNDGKRSEWCEFLNVGDEVDIVPTDQLAALAAFGQRGVVAITRKTRPPGAEPTVAAVLGSP